MLMRTKSLHRQEVRSDRRSNHRRNINERNRHHHRVSTTGTPTIGRNAVVRSSWGGVGKWLASSSTTSPIASGSPLQPFHGGGSYGLTAGMSVSPPLQERQLLQLHKQTPAMTLVLRKLRELLPEYCQAMAECQFVKCCSLVDKAVSSSAAAASAAAANSSSSASPPGIFGSPIFGGGSPSSRSSPGRSPMRNWLTRGGVGGLESSRNDSSSSVEEFHAAAVLESKMDVLFLLIGVESMYASMAHAVSPQFGRLLATCYEQTIKDLQLLRLTFCDAFLMNIEGGNTITNTATGTEQPQAPPKSAKNLSSSESVAALVASLLFLVSFCQARIQCIQLQSALWHQPPGSTPNFAELTALFKSILPNLLAASQGNNPNKSFSSSTTTPPLPAVKVLATATLTEIGAWSGLCQTAFAVQHCRFAESLLGAQSTKLKLVQLQMNRNYLTAENNNSKKPPILELWLRETLKGIIGTFPIIFDKVSAFAKPLYGFDEDMEVSNAAGDESSVTTFRTHFMADAFEAEVVDALHKYERIGAVSVAVVVDAVRTSNPRVESGFCPVDASASSRGGGGGGGGGTDIAIGSDLEAATRQEFPAVYMRTLSAPIISSLPGSPRNVASPAQSPSTDISGGLLLVGRGMRRDTSRKDRLKRAGSLQYDDASTSSPQLLAGARKSWSTNNEDAAVGSPAPGRKKKAMNTLQYGSEDGNWPHSEWTSLAAVLADCSDASVSRLSHTHQTLYCVESLSDSMWLVAMMKNSEHATSGWHWQSARPTTETVEDDLRDLVSNLAQMVRISDRFHAPSAQLFRDNFLDRSSDEIGTGLSEELKERGFEKGEIGEEGIFRLIKNQLKVLAQVNSPNATPGSSSLPTRSRLLRRGRRGSTRNRNTAHGESAAAFFLGRDLMHTID